jgi:hypothetical protein
VREGYRKIVRERGAEPALSGRVRLMLWLLAASAFALGVQAEFLPRYFYTDFPFGRGWVAMDGRYNEHLIRDFGALNLALFVLTVGAIFVGTRAISRIAAVSWIVYSVPHLVYHLRHLTMAMPGADKVAMIGSLSLPIVVAIVVLFDRGHHSVPTVDTDSPSSPDANLTPMSARR